MSKGQTCSSCFGDLTWQGNVMRCMTEGCLLYDVAIQPKGGTFKEHNISSRKAIKGLAGS